MRFPAGDALPPGVRVARPGDYDAIAAVLDSWWGRPILASLPRLFLDHFHTTSLVALRPGVAGPGVADDGAPAAAEDLRGFLVGFPSPALPDEAYIHFVGVAPAERGSGLARALYEAFFAAARAAGRRRVGAITSPVNAGSIAFHTALGFDVEGPVDGYNGPGSALMTFHRTL